MEIGQTAIELFVGFIALFIITKVLGKTQITQITAFDFISALILGELVGNAIYDNNVGLGQILFAVFFWGILIYTMEIVTQKFKKTRKVLEGEPSIVIKNGKVQREQLKKNMLDVNQLQQLLRKKDVFSVSDVEFAILETDGSVSVLEKSKSQTPTKKDLNIPGKPVKLPVTLINDGEIIWDNLKSSGVDEIWLMNQVKSQGINKIEDVFYAEWKEGESLYVIKK